MDFRREEIMPGVFLNVINTDKFKTSALFITLMSQLEHEHAYMDTLLPSVLRRGTVSCPDMASIARRLESKERRSAIKTLRRPVRPEE